MRIGFDTSQTGRFRAGCGNVAYQLIRELAEIDDANEYLLYPVFGDQFWDDAWQEETFLPDRIDFCRLTSLHTHAQARAFWRSEAKDMPHLLGRPDIIHSHNYFCPPPTSGARIVYTLHDLSFLENPDWSTEANRVGCFRGVFEAAIHADFIVAVSDFSRRHFLSMFPHFPADRIDVMHLASRHMAIETTARPTKFRKLGRDGFLLAVGTIEPRKNYEGLIRAYHRALPHLGRNPPPLVVAGNQGWLMERFPLILDELGIARQVIFAGYVDDEELRWLYGNCQAFLYPSLWEGFGLPVVEAMSQGAAVITSTVSSLPEVAGDAAVLVDPGDMDSIAGAIVSVCSSQLLRESLRRRAIERAAQFSWRRSAEKVLGIYSDLMARPARRTESR